uniref:Movement protein n=1 Tax=Grapevine virus L TaxID=2283237 RepID=A0A6N0A3S0_9VIRU|nr:movement protein [Grapevine virus L]
MGLILVTPIPSRPKRNLTCSMVYLHSTRMLPLCPPEAMLTLKLLKMERVESRAFRIKSSKNGLSNFKEMKAIVEKDKVYDEEFTDKLFGKSTVMKTSVCSEVFVVNGKVCTEIELVAESVTEGVDKDKTPFMHVGCIAIGFMSLARSCVGKYKVLVQDERLKGDHKNICAFRFETGDRVAAFADFPDYCIALEDLIAGFTLKVLIESEDAMFEDKAHPLAINIIGVCKFIDSSLETKMLIKKHGKHMYQNICATEVLDPKIGAIVESPVALIDDALMSDVRRAINKANGIKSNSISTSDSVRSKDPGVRSRTEYT